MKYFYSFLGFFITLTSIHFAFGQETEKTFPTYFNDFYTEAGGEVPWPVIIKPSWNFSVIDRIGNGKGFVEQRIDSNALGEWKELEFQTQRNGKTFEIKIVENVLFEVVLTDPSGEYKGWGYIDNWSQYPSAYPYNYSSEDMKNQKELDSQAYFFVLNSEASEKYDRLRLVQIQSPRSDDVFLGLSLVREEVHSNHLFCPVKDVGQKCAVEEP